jgi:uncharacterized membrane protein
VRDAAEKITESLERMANQAKRPRQLKEKLNENLRPPSSLAELTKRNVEAIAQLEEAASAHRAGGDCVADAITRFVGSMLFVYLHVAWFAGWVAANSLFLPPQWRFDPFPFTFLTFVVSLEAIFLSTFILISQNHEERLALRRSHLDLQVNLLSEQENSKMLKILEAIQIHLGMEVDADTKQLEAPAEPQRIAKAIQDRIAEAADEDRKR